MADSILLEDSTIYTRADHAAPAGTGVAPSAVAAAQPNGYQPVFDKILPDTNFMTNQEWTTLFAIIDALLPAVVPQSKLSDPMKQLPVPDNEFNAIVDDTLAGLIDPPPREKLVEYLAFRAVDEAAFRTECQHSIAAAALRMQMAKFLSLLKSVTLNLYTRFSKCGRVELSNISQLPHW